jgi:hypothetical protein
MKRMDVVAKVLIRVAATMLHYSVIGILQQIPSSGKFRVPQLMPANQNKTLSDHRRPLGIF